MFNFSARGWNRTAKIFCGLCILFMITGLGFGIHRWIYLQKAVTAPATITNLIEQKSEEGDTLLAPFYVFKDQTGSEVKIISSTASWPPVGEIGDSVEVLYLPHNPQRSILNNFFSKWGLPAILGGLGLFYFIVFGLVAFFTGRNIKKLANKTLHPTADQL